MEFTKFSECALYFVVFGLLVAWVLQIILLIVVKLGDVKDEIIKRFSLKNMKLHYMILNSILLSQRMTKII